MTAEDIARIAETVQAFYERQPYPRPVDDLESFRTRWEDQARRRAEHHRFWPARPYGPPASVLVAGCGTAQAARYALRYPKTRVVGVDVSDASLEATRALKARYALDNLDVSRLALEEVPSLGESFDQIVCTGVVHHLPDPARGLAALAEVLAPDGSLYLMVYAPYGRAGIYLIQEYGRLLGLQSSPDEIRALAGTLADLPAAHPLRPLLQSPDFRSDAGIADALLNPQDRPYSVPELFHLVEVAGLAFGRWLRQAPYRPQCGAPLLTPHRERLAALPEPDQFAAMELFRGTMTRHSLILRRSDSDGRHTMDFERDEWQAWVPIRMRDTICVEEGVPATAVGVLINRNHTDTDIYLPVDAEQKMLLDRVDGVRTLGEIAGPTSPERVRTLFERLWWYDQVAFDTSGARGDPAAS